MQRDRFCPAHGYLLALCAVVDCHRPIADGRRVCADPAHQEAEALYHLRGQSRFQLQERLQRARRAGVTTLASDGPSEMVSSDDWVDGGEDEITIGSSEARGQQRMYICGSRGT